MKRNVWVLLAIGVFILGPLAGAQDEGAPREESLSGLPMVEGVEVDEAPSTSGGTRAPSTTSQPASPGMGLFSSPILMMVVLFGLMWVLLIAPQRREQKKHKERISQLKSGDDIVTAGGIYGTVRGYNKDGNRITLEIAKGVKIEVSKSAVATILDREGSAVSSDPAAKGK